MKTPCTLAAVALALTINAAQAQEFLPYEGKNTLQEGEGGTKKIVDGIEFWADGAPPKQFKLLGYMTDRRHKTGLIGMMSMASLESDVAKVAKANGGDAVILLSSEAETVGAVGNSFGGARGSAHTFGGTTTARGTGWSSGMSAAVQKNNSKYAVVKYVASESPVAESQPKIAKPEPIVEVVKSDSPQPGAIDTAPATPVGK